MRLSILQDIVPKMKTHKSQLETAKDLVKQTGSQIIQTTAVIDYQHHLLNDEEDYTMGDRGNFFGYGELNTNKVQIFKTTFPVENNFRVDVQTSPSTRFRFDNRLLNSDLGKKNFGGQGGGFRHFTHFKEGYR